MQASVASSSAYSDAHEAASVVVGEVVREAYERTVRVYGTAPSLSLASLDSTATSAQAGAVSSGSALSSRVEGDGSIMPPTVAVMQFNGSEVGAQASDSHWNSVEMDAVDFAPLDGDGDSRWAMGSPLPAPAPSHSARAHPAATKAPRGEAYLLMENDALVQGQLLAPHGEAAQASAGGGRSRRRKSRSQQPRAGSGSSGGRYGASQPGDGTEAQANSSLPVGTGPDSGGLGAGGAGLTTGAGVTGGRAGHRTSPPPSIHALAQRRENLQRIADFLVTNPLAASPAMGLLSPVKRHGGYSQGSNRHAAGGPSHREDPGTFPVPASPSRSTGAAKVGVRLGVAGSGPGTGSVPSRRRGGAAGDLPVQDEEVEGLLAHPENRVAQGLLATTQAVLQASRRADRRLVRAHPRHPAATALPFSPGSSAGAPDVVVGPAGSHHQFPWQQASLASESGLMASTVLVEGAMMSSEIGEGQGWGPNPGGPGLSSIMPSLPGVGGSSTLPSGSRSRSSGGLKEGPDSPQGPGGAGTGGRAVHRRALGLSGSGSGSGGGGAARALAGDGGRVSERSSASGRSAVNAGMRAWDDAVASSVLAVFQTDVTRRVFLTDPEESSK